jgi:hypothetical protein
MPSVEEIRSWLRGIEVKGLATPKPQSVEEEGDTAGLVDSEDHCKVCEGQGIFSETRDGKLVGVSCPFCHGTGKKSKKDRMQEEAEAIKERRVRYMIKGTDDAILLFGKCKNQSLSELAVTREGSSYLRWLIGTDFPKELKDAAKMALAKAGRL